MTRTEMLREAAVLLRSSETMGDGALLKSIALSDRGYPEARERLARFAGDLPRIDVTALRRHPAASFGHAVAQFCEANQITLLRPSERLLEVSRANPVAVRYAATHDLVHVLIDEAADFAGEAAVYGFSCGQRYLRVHWVALVVACVAWSMRRPWQSGRIVRGAIRGYRKGRRAPTLLAERFEDELGEPLDALRVRLGVTGDVGGRRALSPALGVDSRP